MKLTEDNIKIYPPTGHLEISIPKGKSSGEVKQQILDDQEKLEQIKELVKTKMNSTPASFGESTVKVFAHEIYETLTGKSLSDELKEILASQEKE